MYLSSSLPATLLHFHHNFGKSAKNACEHWESRASSHGILWAEQPEKFNKRNI
jgi:hypothetical protein